MQAVLAVPSDRPAWLRLAAEVEDLFGPMVGDPGFEAALTRNIDRGSAWCIRATDGNLTGGLLWSSHPPQYRVSWLAVSAGFRGQGLGTRLIRAAIEDGAEGYVEVETFAPGHVGEAAGAFYERLGFEPTGWTSGDGSRVGYRLALKGNTHGRGAT